MKKNREKGLQSARKETIIYLLTDEVWQSVSKNKGAGNYYQ